MEHLHPESQGIYRCPHCPPEVKVAVPFDEVEFHLRCHGELLFKVKYSRVQKSIENWPVWSKMALGEVVVSLS